MNQIQSYEDLQRFLRDWTNFGGDPAYDFVGALHLWLALLDNLSRCHNEGDLEVLAENVPLFSPEHRRFLLALLKIDASESQGQSTAND